MDLDMSIRKWREDKVMMERRQDMIDTAIGGYLLAIVMGALVMIAMVFP
jgi:hypothetical protein